MQTTDGYSIERAGFAEFGLIHDGCGCRTWSAREFGGVAPGLDHPKVQEAIREHNDLLADFGGKLPIPKR
jgi:hypothetical protein